MRVGRFYVILFLLSLVIAPNVLSTAIGVNKAVLRYDNVLRGGYAQDSIIVSTDTYDKLGIESLVEGDIKDWVSFSPDQLIISADAPGVLTVIIQPPEDVANGIYEGEIRLITSPISQFKTGNLGTSIKTSFLIKVTVTITGDEIISCTVGGFSIADAEITFPLLFSASVINNGNVRIKPDFEVNIWNQDQNRLMLSRKFTHNIDVFPTTTQNILKELDNINLDIGQYWVDINTPMCGQSTTLTFDVVEKGEIVDKGEIINIKNSLWVKAGDIVPIEVVFKNTGTRFESAKIKGTIELAGQIIKVIDTDAVDVAPGETASLETFFNPKMPGQYLIKTRVLYNNKLTFWKNSILNALPNDEYEKRIAKSKLKDVLFMLIVIVLIISILLMLILIKKKKGKTRTRRLRI